MTDLIAKVIAASQTAGAREVGCGSKKAKAILSVAGVNPTLHQGSMAAVCQFRL